MELKKAKLQLEDLKYNQLSFVNDEDKNNKDNEFIKDAEAIDTVLKALEEYEKQMDLDYVKENYIEKSKIESKINEVKKLENVSVADILESEKEFCIDILKELLNKGE